MTEGLGNNYDRKAMLKNMINKLHEGADPEQVKQEFKSVLGDVDAKEIAQIEEEMIKEGMPREEVKSLCGVHMAVLQESLEKEKTLAPPGHPIHTLMEEHNMLLQFAGKLNDFTTQLARGETGKDDTAIINQLNHFTEHFKGSIKHYQREENVLFPYIEKHGITEPPKIMWEEHNEIRATEKRLYELVDNFGTSTSSRMAGDLQEISGNLADLLTAHFYKENNILFPAAMKVITPDEWTLIREEADEIGYCCFSPATAAQERVDQAQASSATPQPATPATLVGEGTVKFDTGELTFEQIDGILNTIPVDVTFVDENGIVRWFNKPEERIFIRTKAVIGRHVSDCHPRSSLDKVIKIISGFVNGSRDKAEFWINYEGKFVYIVFYPVRGPQGEFKGAIEVVQEIGHIQELQGEKRLLDEK